jgi:hypothetical protein
MLYISNFVLEIYNLIFIKMKRTIIIFVVALLVVFTFILWIMNSGMEWNSPEMLMIAVSLVVMGFAVYIGIARLKSTLRKEPAEDELSKSIMTKASSLSYYISIYLWLFIMYISDKVKWETHTMVGAGILGMAVIFFLSWLGVKLFGLRNG